MRTIFRIVLIMRTIYRIVLIMLTIYRIVLIMLTIYRIVLIMRTMYRIVFIMRTIQKGLKRKINKVNTMTTIVPIAWSKNCCKIALLLLAQFFRNRANLGRKFLDHLDNFLQI